MTDNELLKVLNAIKYVPSEDERDEVTQIILKAASESITLDRLKQLTKKEERKADFKEVGTNGLKKNKKQEINSMPDYLKKLFTVNDKIVTYRTTPDGYFSGEVPQGRIQYRSCSKELRYDETKIFRKTACYRKGETQRRLPAICGLYQRLAENKKADRQGVYL